MSEAAQVSESRTTDLAVAAGLVVGALAWFSLTWGRTFDLLDEGHLLNQSLRVFRGDVPLRDFAEAYGPGVFALNAVVLGWFDRAILPVHVTIALFKAGIVGLTYLTTRALVPRTYALFGAGLATVYWGRLAWNLNTPYGSVYTTFFCLLATYLLIRAPGEGRRGLFWAGLAGGTALLFKQSVAAYGLFGLGLSLWAVDTVGERTEEESSRLPSVVVVVLWAVAALVVIAPLRAYLTPREYALHFLPLHVLMGVVAWFASQRCNGMSDRALFSSRMAWLILGAVSVPLATLLLYVTLGGAGALLHTMFVFSLVRENYVAAVGMPPGAIAELVLGVGLLLTAGLLALRGTWAVAGTALALGGLAMGMGVSSLPAVPPLGELWRTSADLQLGILGTAVLVASVGLSWSAIERGEGRAFLPLFFFQAMTTLQVFPRAGFNTLLHAGETVPLLVYVLWRWASLAPARSRAFGVASAAIVAVVPVWLASPIVVQVFEHAAPTARTRSLPWEETAGLALSEDRYGQRKIELLRPLVSALREAEPPDAPLLLLTREPMILYLSRRAPLFSEEQYPLHLVGIRMLPESAQAELLAPERLLETLRRHPETIVVTSDDAASAEYRRRLSAVWSEVTGAYAEERRFGPYAIWRHANPRPPMPGE